jgi:hypothetical protein
MAPRRRWSRRRIVLLVALLLLLGLGAWAAVDAARSYRELVAARAALEDARTALPDAASDGARRSIDHSLREAASAGASAASRLRRSVPVGVFGVLPVVSDQIDGVIRLADDVTATSGAASELLASIDGLGGPKVEDAQVPVEVMDDFADGARLAAEAFERAERGRDGELGPLAGARERFDLEARKAAKRLRDASAGAAALRTFVGADEPRTILVAGANNAEMRDQGTILSYAVLRAETGRLSVVRSGPIEQLALTAPVPVALPAGTSAVFGPLAPAREWRSVNAPADPALSGELMAEMYRASTGVGPDGVVTVDVEALRALLAVTGAVDLPTVGSIGADDVRTYLLSGQYSGLSVGSPAQAARRERVAEVARVVVEVFRSRPVDRYQLARSLADQVAGRHLLAWSSRASEQAVFERIGLAGRLVTRPSDASTTFHVSIQDASATKVDYYVRPEVAIELRVTPAGRVVADVEVSVRNTAPVGAAPSYALGPNTNATTTPGEYVGRVYFWGPIDGDQLDSVPESGLLLSQSAVRVAPGASATARFSTVLPPRSRSALAVRVVPQPRAEPVPVTARLRSVAGVSRDALLEADGRRTVVLRWPLDGAGT